ncbi:TRAP transporter substrate-binding protein DctP [Lachnospiraceae bacterium OttesenSCG-928-E19]|nr:TRAP transporter substrate-binding protein DctP [Lachnospiraceae bacterium OttesenSCG-928-E19]
MLKRGLALLLAGVLSVGLLVGCGEKSDSTSEAETTEKESAEEAESGSGAVVLKFAHADNETSIFHQGAEAFKEKVEELSGGDVTVEIYPSGQLGTLADAAQGIQMGTIDVAPISATVLANFASSIAVYDLPFLIENEQQAYDSLDGDVGTVLEEELEANSMLCKGWWTLGYRNVTTSKDVASIDDLKGQKIRTQNSEIHMAIFEALGVSPTPMDFSELFTALQQKTVDGQENPYVNILQSNIYEVNDTIVETEHVYQVAGLLISPKTWATLSDEQKGWVEEACAYATEIERKACTDDNEAAKEALVSEHGMKVVEFDKVELQERTQSVYDKYSELNDLVEKVKSYK